MIIFLLFVITIFFAILSGIDDPLNENTGLKVISLIIALFSGLIFLFLFLDNPPTKAPWWAD